MEGQISTERQENETTAQYLKRLKDMGFLFHGSSNPDIEELEPRKTVDPHVDRNSDTAVFASDNPTWSAIFGVFGGKGKSWATDVRGNEVIAKIPVSDKAEVEGGTGIVYVLPKTTFIENDGAGQYKSHEPVKPILKVPVNYTDFQQMGGQVQWT